MTPADEAVLFFVYPDVVTRIRRVYADMQEICKMPMRPTHGYRTFDQQDALYAQGRTAPGRVVTWAKGGQSLHNFGVAVDSCFVGKDPYLEKHPKGAELWAFYGKFVKAHGLFWGGDFDSRKIDRPHAQLSYGLEIYKLNLLYEQGKLMSVWAKFDIIRGVPVGLEWTNNKGSMEGIIHA